MKNLNVAVNPSPLQDLKWKEKKLIEFAYSVINNPKHKDEIEYLLDVMGVSIDNLINDYVFYDLDIYAYGNEIYSLPTIRLIIHIHNLLEGSWHQERQSTILDFLLKSKTLTIADLGFGVPMAHHQYILQHQTHQATLCDVSESAFKFAKHLLEYWNANWKNNFCFYKTDMETGEFVGNFDLYLFIDSIEHITDATAFLKKYIQLSSPSSQFLFSLPIGPIIPAHYIEWRSSDEAEKWLDNCGLNIKASREIYVNPAVDLFAEQYNFRYHNLIVLCDKK